MRIERTAKTVIAGLMSVACLASVAACGPGSSSNKANTETEAVSTDLGDTKYELKLWDGAGLKTFDDQLIEAFQKKYPNITIKATYDPDNTSQQNGPRIISAADTPDIARITDINSAVRGNHVVITYCAWWPSCARKSTMRTCFASSIVMAVFFHLFTRKWFSLVLFPIYIHTKVN